MRLGLFAARHLGSQGSSMLPNLPQMNLDPALDLVKEIEKRGTPDFDYRSTMHLENGQGLVSQRTNSIDMSPLPQYHIIDENEIIPED